MRRPASPAHLLKERKTTRLGYRGTRWANHWGCEENSTYASSTTTMRPDTSRASTSSSAMRLPVGLFGEQSTINFVDGVRAASTPSTSTRYSTVRGTSIIEAPQKVVSDV